MALNKTRRYSRHAYGDDGVYGLRNVLAVSFVATDLAAPDLAGTAVHAAITGSSGGAVTTTTGITDPDVPRNLVVTPGGTTADVAAADVTITGTNVEGATISETFTFAADATGAVTGNKAFKTVTSIVVPTQDGDAATFAVTTGAKLGIGMRNLSSMPIKVLVDNAGTLSLEDASASAFSSSAVESNTVTTTTANDGAKRFRVYVLNYKWTANPTNGNPSWGL